MADSNRPPIAVRIVRPYASVDALLEAELETIGKTSVVLIGAHPRPAGVVLRFEVTLSTGATVLRGEGRVLNHKESALHGQPGLTLRFTRLDPRSKALVDRATAMRAGPSVPVVPVAAAQPAEDVAPPSPPVPVSDPSPTSDAILVGPVSEPSLAAFEVGARNAGDEREPAPPAEPEPTHEAAPELEAAPPPEPEPEPEAEPTHEAAPTHELHAELAAEPEPEPVLQAAPESEPTHEPEADLQAAHEPAPEPEADLQAAHEPAPTPEPEAELQAAPDAEPLHDEPDPIRSPSEEVTAIPGAVAERPALGLGPRAHDAPSQPIAASPPDRESLLARLRERAKQLPAERVDAILARR